MEYREISHPFFRESLYITNGIVELIIPLSYGIRIGHFALCGEGNVLFEQPWDATEFTTPEGWRHGGGHRFWITPETAQSYYPDNNPISYTAEENTIVLVQQEDPWLRVKKSLRLTLGDDASVQVCHRLENTGEKTLECALWGVTALAGGGTAHIPLLPLSDEYQPVRNISLWDFTDLSDPRLIFDKTELRLESAPIPQYCKLGIGHPDGPVWYENKKTVFQLEYPVERDKPYPDRNVSFEAFLCQYMIELESLSALTEIPVGEAKEYTETWRLRKNL